MLHAIFLAFAVAALALSLAIAIRITRDRRPPSGLVTLIVFTSLLLAVVTQAAALWSLVFPFSCEAPFPRVF